jgi:hypothetical protein
MKELNNQGEPPQGPEVTGRIMAPLQSCAAPMFSILIDASWRNIVNAKRMG